MDFSIGYSVNILGNEVFPSKPREYKEVDQNFNGGPNSFSALIKRNQYQNGSGLWSLNIHIQDIIRSMLFELTVGSKNKDL